MLDLWRRLMPCLESASSGRPWSAQRVPHVTWDSLHQRFRRRAEPGLLCRIAALPRGHGLVGLECFLCRAVRQAHRIRDVEGIRLARRPGMLLALRAPPYRLPDLDLSEATHSAVLLAKASVLTLGSRALARLQVWKGLLGLVGGAVRWRREWEPA